MKLAAAPHPQDLHRASHVNQPILERAGPEEDDPGIVAEAGQAAGQPDQGPLALRRERRSVIPAVRWSLPITANRDGLHSLYALTSYRCVIAPTRPPELFHPPGGTAVARAIRFAANLSWSEIYDG